MDIALMRDKEEKKKGSWTSDSEADSTPSPRFGFKFGFKTCKKEEFTSLIFSARTRLPLTQMCHPPLHAPPAAVKTGTVGKKAQKSHLVATLGVSGRDL